MQVGMGWGEWASQVEHSSTREQGKSKAVCAYAHPFVRVPQFGTGVRITVRVRYGGVMVCHGHGRGGLGVHAHGDGVG